MKNITRSIKSVRQHYHANRLRAASKRQYAADPGVVFHNDLIKPSGAIHGVNTTEEMMNSAVPVAD